jgi:alpha-ketoglutaric semialdehyde dehydrogenase
MKKTKILHWLNNEEQLSKNEEFFEKKNPANGQVIFQVARGGEVEINLAVESAVNNFYFWSQLSIVKRAEILRRSASLIDERKKEIAEIVSMETGKSEKDALGEVFSAVEMGYFIAGEGRRYYGHTSSSAIPNRTAMTIRQPVGICGLIISANTPIANVAWKVFPALLCGNTIVLKPSEDAPYTALWFAQILKEAGLPTGVLSVIQGNGQEAGTALVNHFKVDLISFTGSVDVGKYIQRTTADKLTKVCLELGGKNALIVCDDADLEVAAKDAVLSAFSNAGQRCAAASRIIVFDLIYDTFKKIFLEKTNNLLVGSSDGDDFGPVINERQLEKMLNLINEAVEIDGATLIAGGKRMAKYGYFMEPTILENVSPNAAISQNELFGPITCLYKVKNFVEAMELNNNTNFGLTAALHTNNIHRIQQFQQLSRTGVVSINGPTYGSEPHMPFGGLKNSGNGFREAGTEVLDVYSDWKTVYIKHDPSQI